MENQKSINYRVAMFGTYDLPSLGDTMFPVIFKKEMEKRFGNAIQVDLYSPRGTETPYNDLPRVYSIDDLKENHKETPYKLLVIGGGEFIHFSQVEYIATDGQKKFYESGDLWEKPQMIAEKLGIPVIWNCVGVTYDINQPIQIKRLVDRCINLKYLSVRDRYSKIRLASETKLDGIHEVADMLWLFNDYFSKEYLERIKLELSKKYCFLQDNYIVLQYGTSWEYKKVVDEVIKLADKKQYKVIAMVVNYCHQDQEIVDDIKRYHDDVCVFEQMLSPIEIMSVIQGAKIFIGTSLHGNVTAMSYGVNNICLDMYPYTVSKMDGIFDMIHQMKRIVRNPQYIGYKSDELQAAFAQDGVFIKDEIAKIKDRLKEHFDFVEDIIRHQKTDQPHQENTLSQINSLKILFDTDKDEIITLNTYHPGEECQVHVADIETSKLQINIVINEIFRISDVLLEVHNENYNMKQYPFQTSVCKNIYSINISLNSKNKIDLLLKFKIEKNSEIENEYYRNECVRLEQQKEELHTELIRKQGHVEYMLEKERDYQNQLTQKNKKLESHQEEINNKNAHIEQLLEQECAYMNLLNTKGVRLLRHWWNFKEKLFPQGSKRRFLAKMLKKFLRHPIYMLKKCTPSRIKKTLHYMRNEDGAMLERRLDAATLDAGESLERMKLELFPELPEIKSFSDVEKLVLPYSENPTVSIVIPVYNQFGYTYNCLKSIIKNTTDVEYEIIIGDDCSTDITQQISELVENVIVAKTKTNVRFLRNCNNAAKLARGKYILFLNNDTQVLPNWLSSLVELIERKDDIGMVGSKLLYPDGTLQEAGGIIWGDGHAWNYGNGQSPNKPEFNYVKEVDYISGAAIMIRRNLWEEIGGFDELFNPAYCEDSDLAFEVRKHGYKLMYQPLSMVVHFEGKSNGTDLSSGVKKYQVENQVKLKKKWEQEFTKQAQSEDDLFHARERSMGKKTILVIDHYIPQIDRDAGSKTTWQYLQMFVEKGYNVKFIGDNFYQDREYASYLEQIGIEILYGPWYAKHWKEWILENQNNIDFAYLNRPHITKKYIDFIKNETNIKCIYYGHDLHFLRIRREYELNHDEKLLAESEEWKETELSIMKKAAMNYYPSYIEEQEIHKIDASIPVKAITAYVYEEFRENINQDFDTREGILFVGGFGHPPNEDAVLWFAEHVYPKIREKLNVNFYIVGAKVTDRVQQLEGNGTVVKGFVTEEELKQLYDSCKMVVVPLRYGAGVKGKVVEAMYYGIPIVSTSVGTEGIDGVETFVEVQNDADKFAESVVKLYNDSDTLRHMSEESQAYIKEHNSIEAVWNIVKDDFS